MPERLGQQILPVFVGAPRRRPHIRSRSEMSGMPGAAARRQADGALSRSDPPRRDVVSVVLIHVATEGLAGLKERCAGQG